MSFGSLELSLGALRIRRHPCCLRCGGTAGCLCVVGGETRLALLCSGGGWASGRRHQVRAGERREGARGGFAAWLS